MTPASDERRVVVGSDYRVEYGRGEIRRGSTVEIEPTALVLISGDFDVNAMELTARRSGVSLVLVDAGNALGFESRGGASCEWLSVSFGAALAEQVAERLGTIQGGQLVFRSPFETPTRAVELVARRLAEEFVSRSSAQTVFVDDIVRLFALDVFRDFSRIDLGENLERSRVGIVDRRLRRAIEFIHDNHGRELATSEIAEAAYLSEFHFARLFKKLTGQTPHAYLAGIRIERARRLLSETDLSIAEIGERVGYQSASHFTKVFRESTGSTPTQFKDALSGGLSASSRT